jgi:hypothetical protein
MGIEYRTIGFGTDYSEGGSGSRKTKDVRGRTEGAVRSARHKDMRSWREGELKNVRVLSATPAAFGALRAAATSAVVAAMIHGNCLYTDAHRGGGLFSGGGCGRGRVHDVCGRIKREIGCWR